MKWFKHMTDSLDDPFIHELMDNFSHLGYAVWFGLIEIIAKENKNSITGNLSVSPTYLRRKLRTSPTKLREVLDFCQTHLRLTVNFSEKNWEITFPKIAKIKDNYTKDLQAPCKKLSIEEEEEEEKEVDKKKIKKEKKIKPSRIEVSKEDELPDWIPKDAWEGYLEMRLAKKKKPTPRAIKIILNQLEVWHKKGHSITEILNASIVGGWTSVYEPKNLPASLTESGLIREPCVQCGSTEYKSRMGGVCNACR